MPGRCFAIVPAAGRSVRMGQPKLLLPWGPTTVIEAVIAAWRQGGVETIVMTVHGDDQTLANLARSSGATVVTPATPPPDMKASVRCALDWLREQRCPTSDDHWAVAPADLPQLDPRVIAEVVRYAPRDAQAIVIPVDQRGRRGHPVRFPWPLADAVALLAENQGLNALFECHPVETVSVAVAEWDEDLDTPDDYRRSYDRYHRHDRR